MLCSDAHNNTPIMLDIMLCAYFITTDLPTLVHGSGGGLQWTVYIINYIEHNDGCMNMYKPIEAN